MDHNPNPEPRSVVRGYWRIVTQADGQTKAVWVAPHVRSR